jgi:hypothetical protein
MAQAGMSSSKAHGGSHKGSASLRMQRTTPNPTPWEPPAHSVRARAAYPDIWNKFSIESDLVFKVPKG